MAEGPKNAWILNGARPWRLALVFGALVAALVLPPGTALALTQTTIVSPDGMTPPAPPEGGIRWETLKDVDEAADPASKAPKFGPRVQALDGTEVKLRGFMMPLEQAPQQSRFVLTALPPTCPFCLPAGPDQLVEIECREPVKFTFDPVTIAGRFQLVRDDPAGLLYRMTAAKRVGD